MLIFKVYKFEFTKYLQKFQFKLEKYTGIFQFEWFRSISLLECILNFKSEASSIHNTFQFVHF